MYSLYIRVCIIAPCVYQIFTLLLPRFFCFVLTLHKNYLFHPDEIAEKKWYLLMEYKIAISLFVVFLYVFLYHSVLPTELFKWKSFYFSAYFMRFYSCLKLILSVCCCCFNLYYFYWTWMNENMCVQ